MVLEDKYKFGYEALLRNETYEENSWRPAYGILGGYYTSYCAAKEEINWLLANYPDRYTQWRIHRIVLNQFGESIQHNLDCALAESVNTHNELRGA